MASTGADDDAPPARAGPDLSADTGISASTLSRPESGDPRVHPRPVTRDGTTLLPLTRRPGGLQAFTMILPAREPGEVAEVDTRTPHGSASAGPHPAEVLGLLGPQGERLHVRARPRADAGGRRPS